MNPAVAIGPSALRRRGPSHGQRRISKTTVVPEISYDTINRGFPVTDECAGTYCNPSGDTSSVRAHCKKSGDAGFDASNIITPPDRSKPTKIVGTP